MALKVVVGEKEIRHLSNEFDANGRICHVAPAAVIAATRYSETKLGAGMLMEELGCKVVSAEPGCMMKALRALQELHAAGYTHGSARLDNLLSCGERLKWCDVQRARRHFGAQNEILNDIRQYTTLVSFVNQ